MLLKMKRVSHVHSLSARKQSGLCVCFSEQQSRTAKEVMDDLDVHSFR